MKKTLLEEQWHTTDQAVGRDPPYRFISSSCPPPLKGRATLHVAAEDAPKKSGDHGFEFGIQSWR